MTDSNISPRGPILRLTDPDGSHVDMIFCTEGLSIGAGEACAAAREIEVDENNLKARLLLLGHYFPFQARLPQSLERQKHILWMVDHRPSDYVCGTPMMMWDGRLDDLYQETKEHWLQQVPGNPINAAILANAGQFFALVEPQLAIEYLRKALRYTPGNKNWLEDI